MNCSVPGRDRPAVFEAGLAVHDIDSLAAQFLGRLKRVHLADGAAHVVPHFGHVDRGSCGLDAEQRRAAALVRDFRGFEQRLAWHAAGPGAVTSHAALFDQYDARSQTCGEARGCQSSRSGADDGEVVFLAHAFNLPTRDIATTAMATVPNVKPSIAYLWPSQPASREPATAPRLSNSE